MTIELNMGNLLFIVFALVSAFWTLLKVSARQFERYLDKQFVTQEESRRDNYKQLVEIISEHTTQLAEQQLQIESIRNEQRHMLTHRDVSELQQRLASLESTSKSQSEELRATRHAIEWVRDFLVNKNKS